MPKRPYHLCKNHPLCQNLVQSKDPYCAECRAKIEAKKKKVKPKPKAESVGERRLREARESAHARGYGRKWRAYRLRVLAKHPLCEHCKLQNKVTASTDVDHIIAVSGPDDPLFWEPSNHQALCHSCHSRKTVLEDGGFTGKEMIEDD